MTATQTLVKMEEPALTGLTILLVAVTLLLKEKIVQCWLVSTFWYCVVACYKAKSFNQLVIHSFSQSVSLSVSLSLSLLVYQSVCHSFRWLVCLSASPPVYYSVCGEGKRRHEFAEWHVA